MPTFMDCLGYGFYFDYTQNTGLHLFCGDHEIPGAVCPNCGKKLLRFFSIDMHDDKLTCLRSVLSLPMVHLLFCWTCAAQNHGIYYSHTNKNSIQLHEFKQFSPEVDFPYKNYPLFFHGRRANLQAIDKVTYDSVVALMEDRASAIDDVTPPTAFDHFEQEPLQPSLETQPPTEQRRSRAYTIEDSRHQIGGKPYWNGDMDTPSCIYCRQDMEFFANVANDCMSDIGFTDCSTVQVPYHICPACLVFHCTSIVD